MKVTIGKSVKHRPIEAFLLGSSASPTLLIFGGFHGDEPQSVSLARRLSDWLEPETAAAPDVCWVIVPLVNPDGYARRRRRNVRGVDINRNFPTQDWVRGRKRSRMFGGDRPESEPETRAVMKAVQRFGPRVIVSIHSISGGRQCNNYNGPGRRWAKLMARCNSYPVTDSIGYPTPGSFGTWAGVELGIPTITLELPTHHSLKRCWADNRGAFAALGVSLSRHRRLPPLTLKANS